MSDNASDDQYNAGVRLSLLSEEQARAIAAAPTSLVSAIVKLASFGLKPEGIKDYAVKIDNGDEPDLPRVNTEPRPITIVAGSFVKDRGQYNGTYGLSAAQAGELHELLLSDPAAAMAEIERTVSAVLRKRGSPKAVRVISSGSPGSGRNPSGAPASGDGGLGLLKAEIRKNSGVYGSYKFEASDSKKEGNYRFYVPLGGGLYVFGQSKALCVAAARIVRVKGRHEPLVSNFVAYWTGSSAPKFHEDISEKITFDGRLGPGDAPPHNPSIKAKTSA